MRTKRPTSPRYPETEGGLVYPEAPVPPPRAPQEHEPPVDEQERKEKLPPDERARKVMRKVTDEPRRRGDLA